MSIINQNLLLTPEGYQISRSVRTRQSASAYFSKTFGVAPTSNQKGTFSFWFKRGLLSYATEQWLFACSATNRMGCYFAAADYLSMEYFGGLYLATTQKFRDPSAWYHFVIAIDSTQATASNRAKMYINGVQVTSFSTEQYPTQNAIFDWVANGQACKIGDIFTSGRYFDGYIAEFNYIDGQQVAVTSFGETDGATGVWKPKKYLGTYGTNGFYLPFSDNASLTRLGFDQRPSTTVYANGWRNSFNGSASLTAATNAAFAVGTNNFTMEAWIKPTSHTGQIIFVASNGIQLGYQNTSTWGLCQANVAWQLTTTTMPTLNAWNHVVVVRSGTGTNQTAIFLNGTRVAQGTISTSYAQNSCVVGSGITGDLTNVRLVNGTAIYDPTQTTLTVPTAPLSNVTNTAILTCQNETFVDNSSNAFSLTNSATTSARDSTFNTCNDWTPNNISITAGVTYDSMLDVPTPYADGGNGRGNYAVLNPLSTGLTISAGNLAASAGAAHRYATSTVIPSSGKWYWEYTLGSTCSGSVQMSVGVGKVSSNFSVGTNPTTNGTQLGIYLVSDNGSMDRVVNGSSSGASATTVGSAGSIYQIAFDADNGKMYFGVNNTFYSSTMTTTGNPSAGTNETINGLTGELFAPLLHHYANSSNVNFGQRPFTYTPPTGFKALNTQNLPDSTIKKGNQYFDIVTYQAATSNGTYTHGSLAFTPDLSWIKNRDNVETHYLIDSVRGNVNVTDKFLTSAGTNAEGAINVSGTTFSVTSTGYQFVETSISTGELYFNNRTYVGWNWKKGATQGFDIVTFTKAASTAETFSHSLGVAPKMIIAKTRGSGGYTSWAVWHTSIGIGNYLELNTTAASQASTTIWNNTLPTSSVFSLGTAWTAASNPMVAYLFSEVAGFSKFGSYTGNGSADGTFVYCGFRPRFVLVKATGGAYHWWIWDTARNTYNAMNDALVPDLSVAEQTPLPIDCLANGFKLRTSNVEMNASGVTYIYAAFAENPFKNSLAR